MKTAIKREQNDASISSAEREALMADMRSFDEHNSTHEAILSSGGGFTAFSFGGYNIRFRAPYSLERYVAIATRQV